MSDCLLGVHDGPKVAMLGDQLVNGARISPRRKSPSTINRVTSVGADDRVERRQLSATFVGLLKTNWRLPVGVHRPSSATGDHESGLGVGFPRGGSGHHLVALKTGPTAELEYMLQEPGVVGSNPIGATCNTAKPAVKQLLAP